MLSAWTPRVGRIALHFLDFETDKCSMHKIKRDRNTADKIYATY